MWFQLKTWSVNAKYMYRNTYFFSSNYGSIGVTKSFLPVANSSLSGGSDRSFLGSINALDAQVQDLYNTLNAKQLKDAVADVEARIINLRDANKPASVHTETLQNSDNTDALQARYDGLNDMLIELESVSLDDYDPSGGNKKQWLT